MSTATLREKLTFDQQRLCRYHVTIAKGCRAAARLAPEHRTELRSKMRLHALLARGRASS